MIARDLFLEHIQSFGWKIDRGFSDSPKEVMCGYLEMMLEGGKENEFAKVMVKLGTLIRHYQRTLSRQDPNESKRSVGISLQFYTECYEYAQLLIDQNTTQPTN